MKANELRIGNWVNFTYKHKGEYNSRACRVIGLDDAGQILVLDKGLTLELRGEAQPIPLSPEVLEACGFAKDEQANGDVIWFRASVQYIYPKSGHPHFMHYGYPISSQRCQSLHQLQNLYFSLTGEELNYSPKIKNL